MSMNAEGEAFPRVIIFLLFGLSISSSKGSNFRPVGDLNMTGILQSLSPSGFCIWKGVHPCIEAPADICSTSWPTDVALQTLPQSMTGFVVPGSMYIQCCFSSLSGSSKYVTPNIPAKMFAFVLSAATITLPPFSVTNLYISAASVSSIGFSGATTARRVL